jgi:hypothetical protein
VSGLVIAAVASLRGLSTLVHRAIPTVASSLVVLLLWSARDPIAAGSHSRGGPVVPPYLVGQRSINIFHCPPTPVTGPVLVGCSGTPVAGRGTDGASAF